MKTLLGVLVVLLGLPAAAAAQARMPHEGASAVGADVGVFIPRQDGMSTGPAIEGFYEWYLNARDSLRVGAGWANPKQEADDNNRMRQIRIAGDLVHNWEGGAVHPFVGAGLGIYFLQPRTNGSNVGSEAKKLGGTIFGGAEFFTSKTFSVKGEGRYHIVSKSGSYDPSGLELTIGVKSYF
ncbi:MAG TPA: outer membrane beta-barrel protein [Vicinamibacterales bacterium]|nr:outer membrane beta-barrel protein [Vicinamibacterales bacterium]